MRALIVGGGVIGTSIAYRLAARGADVIVIAIASPHRRDRGRCRRDRYGVMVSARGAMSSPSARVRAVERLPLSRQILVSSCPRGKSRSRRSLALPPENALTVTYRPLNPTNRNSGAIGRMIWTGRATGLYRGFLLGRRLSLGEDHHDVVTSFRGVWSALWPRLNPDASTHRAERQSDEDAVRSLVRYLLLGFVGITCFQAFLFSAITTDLGDQRLGHYGPYAGHDCVRRCRLYR